MRKWIFEDTEPNDVTLGGIPFVSKGFEDIEKTIYKYLPIYAKKSIIRLDSTDDSISAWWWTTQGIVYSNINKPVTNIVWVARQHKDMLLDAHSWDGKWEESEEQWCY